jgi:hypothetical protein
VTDGLVLYLDAANRKSYPGTGTGWTDISGLGNNVTLVNGISFSNTNNGNLIFDGTDDYVDFFAPNLTSVATIEMVCNIGANYADDMFFGWGLYDVWCGGGNLGFNTANGDVYGISSATVSSLGLVNNWKHYVFEMRTDVSYTNNKIYINGSSQQLAQQVSGENSATRTFNSGNGRIAGWRNDNNYRIPMNCAIFKVYNKILSPQEIQQNFNALRGRFGI